MRSRRSELPAPCVARQEVDHEAQCSSWFLVSLRPSRLDLVVGTAWSRRREWRKRDFFARGARRRAQEPYSSCDEKKKVPATGTHAFKVSFSKSCAH